MIVFSQKMSNPIQRIELLQETTEIQRKQNDLLLQRISSLHQTYSEQIKDYSARVRDQYEQTLREYIQQQSERFSELEKQLCEKHQDYLRLKEQTKRILEERDGQHTRERVEWVNEKKAQQEQFEKTLAELKSAHARELNWHEGKQSMLKQHLAETSMSCAQKQLENKQYEKTVADQSERIETLLAKNREWVDRLRDLDEKNKQLEERLSTLSLPRNFMELEDNYKKEIQRLTKENDLLHRSNRNWQSKYSMLSASQKKSSSSSVGFSRK